MDQRKPTAEGTASGLAERVWSAGEKIAELLSPRSVMSATAQAAGEPARVLSPRTMSEVTLSKPVTDLAVKAGRQTGAAVSQAARAVGQETGARALDTAKLARDAGQGARERTFATDKSILGVADKIRGNIYNTDQLAKDVTRGSNILAPLEQSFGIIPAGSLTTGVTQAKPFFDVSVPTTEFPMREVLFGPGYEAVFNRGVPSRAEVEQQTSRKLSEMQTAIEARRPNKDAYKEDWSNYAADISRYGGLSPDFTTAVIMKESTGNPNAVAVDPEGRITAVGLYQFTDATGEEFGLIERDASGKIIRDDRTDPFKSTDAFVRLTQRNTRRFKQLFNRAPDMNEMYMAHMMGPDGYAALYNAPDINAVEALQKNLGISKGKASPMIWRNLPGRTNKEKQERSENITAKEFILLHTGMFNKFIPKQKTPEYRDGGLIGPGGIPMRRFYDPQATPRMQFGYNPPSSMPPARAAMPEAVAPPMPTPTMPRRTEQPGLVPPPNFFERRFPSYQEGGMVGPGGMPMRPAGVSSPVAPTMSAQELDTEIQRMMAQNPQAVQQIQQEIMSAMQTGELTPQELNMMVQLATLAAQNPQMYPQIRQFAIQQGIATEEDLGPTYDQGLVFVILLASKAAQQQAQGGASISAGQVPQAAMQPPVASMMGGGPLPQKSMNADGSVPIIAHEGEYVIPKEIVMRKGTDFFDKLIGKDQNATGDVK